VADRLSSRRIGTIGTALCVAGLGASCSALPGWHESGSTERCSFVGAQRLGPPVSSSAFDGSPTVSASETELFFTSERQGLRDLFVSTRANNRAPWAEPVLLGPPIDDPQAGDFSLRVSRDGKSLFFASNRTGGFGKADLYVSVRTSTADRWGPASNLGPLLNTEAFEAFPTPSADGTLLYFNRSSSFDSDDSDIWVSSRAKPNGRWSSPQRLPAPLNSDKAEFSPSVSSDGNTLYFSSNRAGPIELWVTRRRASTADWESPETLGSQINKPGSMTLAPFISDDQRSLDFMSAQPSAGAACTPVSGFKQVDLYAAALVCRQV